MPDISALRDKAVELGVNAVLPAYSKVAARVNDLGDTRVGRLIDGVAGRGLEIIDNAGRLVPGRSGKDAPTTKRPARRTSSTRPGSGRSKAALAGKLVTGNEPSRPEDLPLVGYDALVADEIQVRLKGLTQSELAQVYKYEKAHDNRNTVLEAIEVRLIDLPLPTYDSLRVAAILDAVNGLTRKELYTIHEYERTTRHRLPIIEKVESLLAS